MAKDPERDALGCFSAEHKKHIDPARWVDNAGYVEKYAIVETSKKILGR